MLKIIILVSLGTYITCFGDTVQDDDWKNKGFYRPRRNYQTQGQVQNTFQPRSQNNPNLNVTRETGFRQSVEKQKVHSYNTNHQRTNAFEISNIQKAESQNLFERTRYNQNTQNAFGFRPNTFGPSLNQNIRKQNSFGTSYSQRRDQNPLVSQHSQNQNPFGAGYNSFSYDLSTQNQNPIGAGFNQKPLNSNLFETSNGQNNRSHNSFGLASSQKLQRQSTFATDFGQNAFQYQNVVSNFQHIANSDQNFETSNSQNTFKGLDYLTPRDKPKPPFAGPTYLPPSPDKPRTNNTKRPTYMGNAAPAMAMLVLPEPEDEPKPTTTTMSDREPSEIFPEVMTTTKRADVAPAMAIPVPPEPEDDPTPTTTVVVTTLTTTTPTTTTLTTTTTTTTTTPPPTTNTPSTTTTPEPNRVLIEETSSPTTTTKRPIMTTPSTTTTVIVTTPTRPTTPYFKAPEYLPPKTPYTGPPPQPAMAMPVPPECDPSDPSTYPLGIDQRYSGGDPCNPTTTTPEPNRNIIQEELTTPTTTTTRKIVTTPSTTTTVTVTTPTTPTTPYFKAPEYLPPKTPYTGPPPQPAMAMPVPPECDPSDPSTYPLGIDQRYSGGDPCNPTTTTPVPNRNITQEELTTPTTTTTRKIVTTLTTPTTPHFKAPEYLPPLNTTEGPSAPARAMPVPEPECDPSDPSTYPLGTNPCAVPPPCIGPSFLTPAPKRVARASSSGQTLRLGDLKGTPRPVWYAGIYDKTYTPHFKPICGGSVLRVDVVISAAHCFWDDDSLVLPATNYAVGANKIYRPWADQMDKRAQKSDVKEIIIPPRFRGGKTSFQDDIAILKLATPFRYAKGLRPLCVNFDDDFEEQQLREGHSGTIAGWGLTDAVGTPTSRLLWLELPYVEIKPCIAGYDDAFLKYITSDKICAGESNTGKALCRGDSGGGLVFWQGRPDNAVPYLRGIASTAPHADNLECNVQTVGTFTQISSHKRFLREHVPGVGDECHFRD